jgi:hypothetical protein
MSQKLIFRTFEVTSCLLNAKYPRWLDHVRPLMNALKDNLNLCFFHIILICKAEKPGELSIQVSSVAELKTHFGSRKYARIQTATLIQESQAPCGARGGRVTPRSRKICPRSDPPVARGN